MKGFFLVSENKNEEFDIKCEINSTIVNEEIPEIQQQLYIDIESTNTIIKSLFNTTNEIKKRYFQKLLSLAQAGLVGEKAQPKLALKSLKKLKEEIIIVEGQKIKNYYMVKLGIGASINIFIAIIVYLILNFIFKLNIFNLYIVVYIGSMLGSWISFGARKFIINFEQLSILEEDMLNTYIRLIYIGICSVIFSLFLNSDLIKINIGNISTENINSQWQVQILLGIICGLIECKLGINIYKKAVNIVGNEE